jgi:hypothetical protein
MPAFSTAPVTVSRVVEEAPPETNAYASAIDHPASPAAPVDVDVDALYDEFLERFKRDLLVEREQLGHLLIDNP